MRTGVLLTGLFLLVVANLLAMWGFGRASAYEGFADSLGNAMDVNSKPIGPFDGVKLETGNNVSSWRYNHPNEPMEGNYDPSSWVLTISSCSRTTSASPSAAVPPMLATVAAYATTPDQRNFINSRGGNRTVEDGF